MRRTKEDSEKTRTAILLAAEELFLEKGVSHTSLEQIARAAGVTRGAVYWHFQNKAHLFNEMLNQVRLPPEQLTERLSGCDGSDPLRSLYDLCLEAVQSLLTQEKKRRILTILMQRCEFTEELREAQERNNAFVQMFVVVKFFWTRRSDGRVMHRRATGRQGWPAFRTVRVIGSQVLNAIGYCYKS